MNYRYGLVKTELDAHTLGMSSASSLIKDCGYDVLIGGALISKAVSNVTLDHEFEVLKRWILDNRITHLGFSYRLDPHNALSKFGALFYRIDNDSELKISEGVLQMVFFAGLPDACELVNREFNGRIVTFLGDETPLETLVKLDIPRHKIPTWIKENSKYDELRLQFGRELIARSAHFKIKPEECPIYHSPIASTKDIRSRVELAKAKRLLPLTRVHVGPYSENREEALALFSSWLKTLRESQFLDIVSVGSSQLSQSNFGENWDGKENGGGVPFNSEFELRTMAEDAFPMLMRAYSGTSKVQEYAAMLDRTIGNCWHALSLWWFNMLDGRGPHSLLDSLKNHFDTLSYIAQSNGAFEPNVGHHFAFRGSDDASYIVSTYLAVKAAKLRGVKTIILQNMLNTPKATWGVRDIVKSRVLRKLVGSLEDASLSVFHQPRAGLDYFSPNLEKAQSQLAAVTALMYDIDPVNNPIPEFVHVVSYSEALFLATPEIINDSIKITKAAFKEYPSFRKSYDIRDMVQNPAMDNQVEELFFTCRELILDIEKKVTNPYSPQGFYDIFTKGYLPVPFLWGNRDLYKNASDWETKIVDGGIFLVDNEGRKLTIDKRLEKISNTNIL